MPNFLMTAATVFNILDARERKAGSRAFLSQVDQAKSAIKAKQALLAGNVDKPTMKRRMKEAQKAKMSNSRRHQGKQSAFPKVAAPPLVMQTADTDYGCYDANEDAITDCDCHSSCKTCGFYDDPAFSDDCITCWDGGEVTQVYDDGTGTCDDYWEYYSCVCHEECYYDEEYEMYWPFGCDYDDDAGDYDCENVGVDDNGDDVTCPYNGWCECDSDCYFEYDMEYYWDNCGCDVGEEFCNYDSGSTGECESCTDDNGDDVYADYDECYNDGLPDAGAAACASECFSVYPNEDYGAGCYYLEDYGQAVCHYMEFDGSCWEEADCLWDYGLPEVCEETSATKLWMSAGAAMGAAAALGLSVI